MDLLLCVAPHSPINLIDFPKLVIFLQKASSVTLEELVQILTIQLYNAIPWENKTIKGPNCRINYNLITNQSSPIIAKLN